MKTTFHLWVLITLAAGFAACGTSSDKHGNTGQNDSTTARVDNAMERNDDAVKQQRVTVADANFIADAANGGMMEVEISKQAMTKAASPDVKAFAKMMVDDHTKAHESLKAIAAQKNIRLPEGLSEQHAAKISQVMKNEGKGFDREYMNTMLKDHKIMSEIFQSEAHDGNDSLIKAYAAATLPTLLHHLKMAEQIHTAAATKKGI